MTANEQVVAGLTKLEHFIALAPKEVPVWFKPKTRPYPERTESMDYCRGCKDGVDCEETEQCLAMKERSLAIHQWDRDRELAMSIQWPIFWAEALCAELDRQKAKATTTDPITAFHNAGIGLNEALHRKEQP